MSGCSIVSIVGIGKEVDRVSAVDRVLCSGRSEYIGSDLYVV